MNNRCLSLLQDLNRCGPRLCERGRSRELSRMQDLLNSGRDVFLRSHLTPGHFTASAFILSPDCRKLLLIHHKKLGLWLQPGGHIEPTDASWQAAVAREAEEETNLVVSDPLCELVDIDIHSIPPTAKEAAHYHFDLRSLYRAATIEVQAGGGVAEARWFLLGEIAASGCGTLADGVRTDESVIRVAREALLLSSVSG